MYLGRFNNGLMNGKMEVTEIGSQMKKKVSYENGKAVGEEE